MTPRFIIRTDATVESGIGHAMRSLTLASALQSRGADIAVAAASLVSRMQQRAEKARIPILTITEAPGTPADAEQLLSFGDADLVVDGYHFGHHFHKHLAEAGRSVTVIDDNLEQCPHFAQSIVNQNPHATPSMYRTLNSSAELLLGLRYAMIRGEIRQHRPAATASCDERGDRVLLVVGGTDPARLTEEVARALSDLPGIDLVVANAAISCRWRSAAPDIALELPDVAVAVIGAGTTMWECAALGIPAIALIVAENQVAAARSAENAGATIVMDCREGVRTEEVRKAVQHLMQDAGLAASLAETGLELVDGQGADRVSAYLVGKGGERCWD